MVDSTRATRRTRLKALVAEERLFLFSSLPTGNSFIDEEIWARFQRCFAVHRTLIKSFSYNGIIRVLRKPENISIIVLPQSSWLKCIRLSTDENILPCSRFSYFISLKCKSDCVVKRFQNPLGLENPDALWIILQYKNITKTETSCQITQVLIFDKKFWYNWCSVLYECTTYLQGKIRRKMKILIVSVDIYDPKIKFSKLTIFDSQSFIRYLNPDIHVRHNLKRIMLGLLGFSLPVTTL